MNVLRSIIEETQKNPASAAAAAAFLSAAVAFLAVFAALITSLMAFWGIKRQIRATVLVADRQIKATVLSANRQNWINELRDEIAKAIQLLRGMSDLLVKPQIDHAALDVLRRDYMFSRAKIVLLTNPDEKDHGDLCEDLRDSFDLVHAGAGSAGQLNLKIDNIVVVARGILKREWERVKALE